MNQTENYLRQRYEATNWPYYGLMDTKYLIGENFDTDIKQLREKQMVQPTPGINGWLIEMINIKLWGI